ncbi:FunK1 protein kinase [Penicillium hispanicum]|uniref:EKC/KEOPS complex subunit BUD32 n=1 Tax=Penicillium cinerascens TaxID=70096 RepID=A0A9W9N8G6_9EURO|nr:FunK1 protein kinase [Penicillium hispanicum]XP_058311013.1 FunK1 protein kinase [Penicillium cinerascens]KAJ5215200.1 FunK1 protein kinase [Penicillium cinerascens]KAJ5569683.1 FunK1 protein kinase [Penicillium hispanicum]
MDQSRLKVIEEYPIGNGLGAIRTSFNSTVKGGRILSTPYTPCQSKDLRRLSLNFLVALQNLPAVSLLPSRKGRGTLETDILKLLSAVTSDNFDFDRIKALLRAALADKLQDTLIWDLVSIAAAESTPPPRPIPSLQETPWSQSTSGIVNSSEFRQNVDPILKLELGSLYVGLPNLCDTFLSSVPECTEGDSPLFGSEGWSGWPAGAKESDVLTWFSELIPKLETFASNYSGRKLLAQPKTPLRASTGKRSMGIGFVNHDITYTAIEEDVRYCWSHILVPGELKSNPEADKASMAWMDLATYAREVLAVQETRRFVLGFTLCGSRIRMWEFDRLGGIASEQFDINKKEGGLQFVSMVLGFLWMNEDGLGFDPTIIVSGKERYIEIERNGRIERLIIDEVMKHAPCIAGRATTCWKAHRKEDPQATFVIKDSWQYTDRDEEGILLQEATEKGVVNVARYYHHETVCVQGIDDDIQNNVRKGLDVTQATNYRTGRPLLASSTSHLSRQGRSSSAGLKRPSSETNATLPSNKRSRQSSPAKPSFEAQPNRIPNRIHRRIILRDYGKPIYKASSREALLAALEDCIEGHHSLHKAGFLHRDISINNLMINEDKDNSSFTAFLIDLDLAVREQRESASGAKGKTGTRAFMAIGALLGNEQHSFMHDLESFFWVLFWICIHYSRPGKPIGVTEFDSWNYENYFLRTAEDNFTQYYQPLIPWVNRLRREVFPNGERWKKPAPDLYHLMKNVLQGAQKDSRVINE